MHHVVWPFFLFIPLFWLLVVALIGATVGRRFRHGGWAGRGPWGAGFAGFAGAHSAEATLAERCANGDIDEKEYRARLEVLRANNPAHPMGR